MRDLLVLAAIGAAITLLFANGALDLATTRLFYNPGEDHWPFGGEMPWLLLYKMAPWITGSLVLGAMSALAFGFVRKREAWRRDATFVLLTLVLGLTTPWPGPGRAHIRKPACVNRAHVRCTKAATRVRTPKRRLLPPPSS